MSDMSFRIDPSRFAQNLTDGGDAVMAPGLFGGIAITRSSTEASSFRHSVEQLGLTHIRWPGGTLSETAVIRENGNIQLNNNPNLPDAYDLGYPELLHPRALIGADGQPTGRDSFTDMLRLAIDNNASFSVILPTQRYVDEPEEAAGDVYDFLNALFVEDRWNGGELPRKIMLDIGNENYNPEEYAKVSVAILRAVRDFRDAYPEEEFTLALQAMQDGPDTEALVGHLRNYMEVGDEGLLAEADSVRVHVLKNSLSALRKVEHGKKAHAINELLEAVRADRDLMGYDPEDEVEVYFSAWTATANDLETGLSLPMSSAIAMISLFTGMAELGTDYAAGWGIGMGELGSHVTMTWLDPETGELKLSPHGEVFRQMAETLPGMKLLTHRHMDAGRDMPVTYFAFSDEAKVAIFVAANDIPDDGMPVEFDLSDFGNFRSFEAESISVTDGWSGEPIVSTPDLHINRSEISVRMTSDYQVIRIIGTFAGEDDDSVHHQPSNLSESLSLVGEGDNDSDEPQTDGTNGQYPQAMDVPRGDDLMLPYSPASDEDDSDAQDDEDDEEEATKAAEAQGTCFVATAAYGNRLHPDVVWLRTWRDTVLIRTAPGRCFVRFYWKVGPVMARCVRADRKSGRMFRGVIAAIIGGLRWASRR